MSTVIKIVGQITLKALTDVKSTTYYYLLQSSIAPAPTKPITNPPTGGWSTTEPGFFSYVPTQDATIVSNKDYYIRSGTGTEQDPYVYTKVTTPVAADINTYYEKIYGDTKSLYVTVQTLYTDNTFEYSEPSLSSSYEAAKEAYNRAKTALDLAGDTNQYFWTLSSAYSTNVPAGVYVTHIPQNQFKPSPAQGNVLVQNTGLTIRNGAVALASLTGSALNFYSPTTHNAAMQLSGQALNFYNPNNDRLSLSLNSNGLNFYGSSIVNPDASLTTTGLVLSKGGIQTGTSGQNGFVYLSSEDYQRKDATHNGITINGHTPTAVGTDDKTIDDPAWREIIGTKFGVDSEGNLYANNANLSNATVEGAITATSLTIGSGSDSYNAINAMNAAGYTIEIINDITAAPNNVVINDNSTYLYPIMYHNGIKVESVDIINTQYIWYRGSDTIGIQGDSSNGGIVADYGYTYRVAYSFDDGEVGQAPSVQQVLVDPSKYITRISDIGITIHPEDTSENNYLQIDGNGITIYKNTDSVAQFGTTARIGRINNSRFLINSNSLQGYDSSNVKYFEVSANGLSWGDNIAATTSAVSAAATTASNYLTDITGGGVYIHAADTSSDYSSITAKGVKITDQIDIIRNGISIATYGSFIRIGVDTDTHIEIDNNSLDIVDNNGIGFATFSVDYITMGAIPSNDDPDLFWKKWAIISNSGFNVQSKLAIAPYNYYSIGGIIESTSYKIATYVGATYFSKYLECQPISGTRIILKHSTGSSIVFTAGTVGTEGTYHYDGVRTISCSQSSGSGSSGSGGLVPAEPEVIISGYTAYILYETTETEAGTYIFVGEHNDTYLHGKYSALFGAGLVAQYECQTAIGKYNSNSKNNIFEIGKGTSEEATSNAFEVTRTGAAALAGTLSQNSDRRLKEHKAYLDLDAVDFIKKLKPAYYIKDSEPHVGFYAQDVESIDPWNCMTGTMGKYKTLGYTELIAPLVTYCQHLEKRITELESQLEGGID